MNRTKRGLHAANLARLAGRLSFFAVVLVAVVLLLATMPYVTARAQTPLPQLTIGNAGPVNVGSTVDLPITFAHGDTVVASFIFAINYDPACLDPDVDNNGIDLLTFPVLPQGYSKSVIFDEVNHPGRIGFGIYLFAQAPNPIPAGELVRIRFTATCALDYGESVTTNVGFGSAPPPSFGTPGGADAEMQLGDGSVQVTRATTLVTPAEPVFTAIRSCNTYGSVSVPANHPEYTYVLAGNGQTGFNKVTATAQPGYVFANGAKEIAWEQDLGLWYPCEAIPTRPVVTPIAGCNQYGSVVFAATEGVTYALSPAGAVQGKVWVSATAQTGWVLKGYDGPWGYDLGAFFACPPGDIEVAPVAPTFTPIAGCGTTGQVHLPVIQGVVYHAAPANATSGIVVVYATAAKGYVLVNYTGPWTLNLGAFVPCTPVTPVRPIVTPIATCGVYGTVVFAVTPGVRYAMAPAAAREGIVTISAAALPGYVLRNYNGPWQYDLGKFFACPIPVTPQKPTYTKAGVGVWGTIVFPKIPGVVYAMTPPGAREGIVIVTATAKPGYVLVGYDGPWQIDLGVYIEPPPPPVYLPCVSRSQ